MMNVTDPFIRTALLGTSSRISVPEGLPEALEEAFCAIRAEANDPESAFYQMAAMAFVYQDAGLMPSTGDIIPSDEAPEETLPYFDEEAGKLLIELYNELYLLLYAYRKAIKCHRIIPPVCLHLLIYHAYASDNENGREERELLASLAGERGRWMLPRLGLSDWGSGEDDAVKAWETALLPERKQILLGLRRKNPAQGRALLQTDFRKDPAGHREILLSFLRLGLSKADEPFLQEVADTDRSENVKRMARVLLSGIPDSAMTQTFCNLLRGHLHYGFLRGWTYEPLPFTPDMKKMGLDEVSGNKKEKDDAYLLRQLAERVPLSFWEEFYGCSAEKAASKLAAKPPFKGYFDLSRPIEHFADGLWAYRTLKENPQNTAYYLPLVGLLTPEQREEIPFRQNFDQLDSVPNAWYNLDRRTWGKRFSHYVISWLLQCSYCSYPKAQSQMLSVYLSLEIIDELEQTARTLEGHNAEARFCEELLRCMRLRAQIDNLFNDNQ